MARFLPQNRARHNTATTPHTSTFPSEDFPSHSIVNGSNPAFRCRDLLKAPLVAQGADGRAIHPRHQVMAAACFCIRTGLRRVYAEGCFGRLQTRKSTKINENRRKSASPSRRGATGCEIVQRDCFPLLYPPPGRPIRCSPACPGITPATQIGTILALFWSPVSSLQASSLQSPVSSLLAPFWPPFWMPQVSWRRLFFED